MIIMPTSVSGTSGTAKESPLAAQDSDESGFSDVVERLRDLLNDGEKPRLVQHSIADTAADAAVVDDEQSDSKAPDGIVLAGGASDRISSSDVPFDIEPEYGVPPSLAEATQLIDEAQVLLPADSGESTPARGRNNQLAEPAAQLWHWHYSRQTGTEPAVLELAFPVQAELRAEKAATLVAANGGEVARVTLSGAQTDGERLVSGNIALAANKLLLQQLTTAVGPAAVLSGKEEVAAQQSSVTTSGINAALGARITAAPVHEWAPVSVEPGSKATLGAQLVVALKDKVEMQLNQEVQQARIKLDPPEMGRLELSIRLDGDRLHIHINASQGAVRDALIAQADRLRNDLLPHHSGGVEVNVGQGSQRKQEAEQQGEQGISLARPDTFETTPRERLGRGWINALV